MDLARTPILPDDVPAADTAAWRGDDRQAEVRAVPAAEFSDPAFLSSWYTLAEKACEPNPYFEAWFMQPSFEQFAHQDTCELIGVFDRGDLVGVLPVQSGRDYYGHPVPHVSAWLHDNAFCGAPLIADGYELMVWSALLDHFDSNPGKALFLHLPGLPADGPVNTALDLVLAQTPRKSVTVEEWDRAMLSSNCDPQTYFEQSMSSKKRKELRRQRKRLSDLGDLVIQRAQGSDWIDAWVKDFLALEADGWKGGAGSALASAPDTQAFFADTLKGAAKAGRLERLSLMLDGRPIAMLANFITPPGVFSFKTTFDEGFARFSPGLLLQMENLELLNRRDVRWADSCAAEGHSMIERIWREKRRIISRNIAIGGPVRRMIFAGLMAYETRGKDKAPSGRNEGGQRA